MSRSTHAGASAGGGDGVPFAELRKKFAGQHGLHLPAVTKQDFFVQISGDDSC